MKKDKYLIIGLISLASVIIFGVVYSYWQSRSKKNICFDQVCVTAEVADNNVERAYGLMNRAFLPADQGMIFIFPNEDKYEFWMKNTIIPLDIIWINQDFQVVDIQPTDPCTDTFCMVFEPIEPARYILEVNQGFTKLYDIKVGDFVEVK